MTSFEIMLFVIVGFICMFAITDRVCKCVEHCSMAKHASESVKNLTKKKEE